MLFRFTARRTAVRGLLVAALLLGGSASAQAWSELGHRVIAQLAQENLNDNVVRRMELLLGKGAKLVDFATWADAAAEERPETEAWRSITVPPNARRVDYARDCPLGDCAPVKLRACVGIVRLAIKPKSKQIDAFKMLVGLAGDLHQPLRAGYPPGHGGAEKPVMLSGRRLELFDAWESALLAGMGSEEQILERARRHIDAESKSAWAQGSLRDWTWETHQAAVRNAYDSLQPGASRQLNEAYIERAEKTIEEQLAKAAVRLAYLLTDAWP